MSKSEDRDQPPSPVDEHVGSRLRLKRVELRLSQGELANLLGLSFRQIQKYEKGSNRMGASRLYDAARVLGVSVDYFFAEMNQQAIESAATHEPAEHNWAQDTKSGMQQDVIELIRAYQAISDLRIRRRVQDLAKALADKKDL